jgi:DNA-binding helix-hairpin-helix protein with protein kinase domain
LAVIVAPRVTADQRAAANRECAAAQAAWSAACSRWRTEATRETFAKQLEVLQRARSELGNLSHERSRRVGMLEAGREFRQRVRYLDRFRIDRAKIPGIGPSRTAMLASYGIETAADVDSIKIDQIPGFGRALTSELFGWRQSHELNFRPNPTEPIDRSDVDKIDRDIEALRRSLLVQLEQGPQTLKLLGIEIPAARRRLMPGLERAWNDLKIAEARRAAL